MTKCEVYDDSYEKLMAIAEKMDTTVAEVIDALLDFEDEL